MPIRMVKDPGNKRSKRKIRTNNQSNLSSSGGSGLGSIISLVLPFLLKKPKLLLVVVVLGAIGYLFFGKGCSVPNIEGVDVVKNLFQTGGEFNKEKYE